MTISQPPLERALTLHRPWAGLILRHNKTVENRTWAPSTTPLRIAVHAGRTVDREAVAALTRGRFELPDYLLTEGLVGTVLVTEAHQATACPSGPGCRQWGMRTGWHWTLTDPRPTPTTIPASGRQRLWRLTPNQIRLLQQGATP